ncbi:protein kinase domain-containing protein [Granulicella aggregans]|uniref:protein kinase domain-containing protein n=1 Tax=Granulicella aggregans TaxID=474949 RepID=UPI0021DF5E74|nr:winged helix-turn-helix domain-containing protein [Granulicella aggregans]
MENGPRSTIKEGRKWQFAWCEFIELSRQLLVHGQPVKIEAKPADLLVLLLERPDEVHTKDALLGANWPNSRDGASDASLTTAIRKLRSAFGGGRDEIILTVPNVGYRMAVPVVETVVKGPELPALQLAAGDPIPGRPNWRAQRSLDAFQTVWLAEQTKTREVRVFKFAVDGVRLRALQREVTLSRLLQKSLADTSGFVRVMDWEFEDLPYFTESEYGGVNLLDFAEEEQFKSLSLDGRVALAATMAESVAAAHSLGILHNDLKPSNVLILQDAEGDLQEIGVAGAIGLSVKVADFGVASLTQPERLRQMEITQHGFADGEQAGGTPVGTGMYRAPETLAGGPASTLADVYALGVMLYQILCGDFIEPLSPGWEDRVEDALLREDIAAAANVDPAKRIPAAADLAVRLRTMDTRRADRSARLAEAAQREHDRSALEQARLRRPWIGLAMLALAIGLCASIWFGRRAARARNTAEQSNRTLTEMNRFLAEDLLGQSNPLASQAGSAPQVALIDAINKVLPQIDRRFANAPQVAARLHVAVGGALDARTDYVGAEDQFAQGAQRFREAEGPLSQSAILAELRRENVQFRSHLAGSIEAAKAGFAIQQQLIARLHQVSPEVQGWQALVASGTQIYSSNPEPAVTLLNQAIQRGEATPGFSPNLLIALEARLSGAYLRLNDGAAAERAARQVIATITSNDGPESNTLFQPQMFLQEALYLERKYPEALAQGKRNYLRFSTALGPQNQLTLAALTMLGQTEGAMEDYTDAIRDELILNKLAEALPGGSYLAESSLADVAGFECHSNRIEAGVEHARQVIAESSKGASPQPVFLNVANLTLAECRIAQMEDEGRAPRATELTEANRLLNSVSIETIIQTPGYADVEGNVDAARARLALLEGKLDSAKLLADKAEPYLAKPEADAYERRAVARVNETIAAQ